MKRFIYILIAALVVVFSGCEKVVDDYLSVELHDQPVLDEIFSQGNTAHRYLRHIYSFIPEDESISNREGWVVARSDEAQFSWTQWVYYLIFREGNYSSATTVSAAGFLTWQKFYTAISQCTVFINNIDLMKEYNNKSADELALIKNQMKAEAKFLCHRRLLLETHARPGGGDRVVLESVDVAARTRVAAAQLERHVELHVSW